MLCPLSKDRAPVRDRKDFTSRLVDVPANKEKLYSHCCNTTRPSSDPTLRRDRRRMLEGRYGKALVSFIVVFVIAFFLGGWFLIPDSIQKIRSRCRISCTHKLSRQMRYSDIQRRLPRPDRKTSDLHRCLRADPSHVGEKRAPAAFRIAS